MTSPTSPMGLSTYVLKIARGSTQFPVRPIREERFLIGAGSNCQLQLGGDIPILHSIIISKKDQLWIDAVVPTPALVVNGRSVRESVLAEGDTIEIGTFCFEIGLKNVSDKAALDRPTEQAEIAQKSASELADLLELEMDEQKQLSTRQQRGADALLKAALAAGASEDQSSIEELIEQLKQRVVELDQREGMITEHPESLEKKQRDLQTQIESVTEDQNDSDEPPHLRLTA